MKGLLNNSLSRVSSLEEFNKNEITHITEVAKDGKNKYAFGSLFGNYLFNYTKNEEHDERYRKTESIINKYLEVVDSTSDGITTKTTYVIKDEKGLKKLLNANSIQDAEKLFYYYSEMEEIHYTNILISLTARFEEFLSRFFKELFLKYPSKYLDNSQVSFSEIKNKENVKEIEHFIIERQVDQVMRSDFNTWLKTLKEHGMKFDSCSDLINQYVEINERRNLYVHNNGRVNSQYTKNVKGSKLEKGTKLILDEVYISESFRAVKLLIFTIMLEAGRFVDKEDYNDYIYNDIFLAAFKELKEKNYQLSEFVFLRISTLPRINTVTSTMARINYWIAVKNLRGQKTIKEEVEAFDDSALEDQFKMAKLLLLGEYNKANTYISASLKNKKITQTEIDEWPLFEDYRVSKEYEDLRTKEKDLFGLATSESDNDYYDEAKDETDA